MGAGHGCFAETLGWIPLCLGSTCPAFPGYRRNPVPCPAPDPCRNACRAPPSSSCPSLSPCALRRGILGPSSRSTVQGLWWGRASGSTRGGGLWKASRVQPGENLGVTPWATPQLQAWPHGVVSEGPPLSLQTGLEGRVSLPRTALGVGKTREGAKRPGAWPV